MNQATTQDHSAATCPFCALHCDDLIINSQPQTLTVVENGCHISEERFSQAPSTTAQPLLKGQPVTLEQAIEKTVELLNQAQLPIFVSAGDVASSRAACSLAERCRGIIDHPNSAITFNLLNLMQRDGWLSTSFSEARNRADLILIIGEQLLHHYPRLIERVIRPQQSLFDERHNERKVMLLGSWDEENIPPALQPDVVLSKPNNELSQTISLLRTLLHKRPLHSVDELLTKQLTNIAEQLTQAEYPVIIWAAQECAEPQQFIGLVRDLSEYSENRVMALPLAGDNGAATLQQVSTWHSGFPGRTAFSAGYPEYDPYRYDYQRLLAENELDLVFWLDNFGTCQIPAQISQPAIVLAPTSGSATTADVFIPTGIAGIDHAGQTYRSDGVALPLHSVRQPIAQQAAHILGQIMARLP